VHGFLGLLVLCSCSTAGEEYRDDQLLTSLNSEQLIELCRTTKESDEYISTLCEFSAVLTSAALETTDEAFAATCASERTSCSHEATACSMLSSQDFGVACQATVADWNRCNQETMDAMQSVGTCRSTLGEVMSERRPDGMSPGCRSLLECSPSMAAILLEIIMVH
jgi:hypothetical protein